MHSFTEIVEGCTAFTLNALKEANEAVIEEMQTSGATAHVKALQMIQMQKAISAVGMFSMFEALLQDRLNCTNGFNEADLALRSFGDAGLQEDFDNYYIAVNVLKHGRGTSYDKLVAKATSLPFKIKLPGEHFFCEGDVSEVSTLVEVDDVFVQNCAGVIRRVSEAIRKVRPEFYD